MAYRWEWNMKCGTLSWDGNKVNLYEGNGFLIGINEWKEEDQEKYRVAWFFVDKEHAKASLGLKKGYDNMFEENVDEIVLYMDKCRNWKDIIDLFKKSQPRVIFKLLPTEPKAEQRSNS